MRPTEETSAAEEQVGGVDIPCGQLRPVAWLNGAGQVYATFVYGLKVNVPEYMVTAAGTYRILTDHLGSPRLVVNTATGAVAQRMDYDAWGQVKSDTSPGFQPFGFAGGLSDRDTGLVRFGARDYDPRVGRWTSKDPIGFEGGLANLFEYSGCDPVNYLDPGGTIYRLAMRATKGLRLAFSVGPRKAIQAMKSGEGIYATRGAAEARQAAQKYSTTCGGGGNVVMDAAKPGKYAHYHGLDKAGERLPGHAWFGEMGALFFEVLDADGDGEFTFVDAFELANPVPWSFEAGGEEI